jgi:hypothetical protein
MEQNLRFGLVFWLVLGQLAVLKTAQPNQYYFLGLFFMCFWGAKKFLIVFF